MNISQGPRSKRARLPRTVPAKACWPAMVFFDPTTEAAIKYLAARDRIGVGRLIELWCMERLAQEHFHNAESGL